jgi:molybdopterin-guanine dinucleotide biosynthesis protein A
MPRPGRMTMAPKETIVGVLLAGGQSRRMGGIDKTFAPLGARPMIDHALARLRPQCGTTIISSNGAPDQFAHFNLPVVADPIAGFAGPLAGLLGAMKWAGEHAKTAKWIVTAATDTPFFPDSYVDRLARAATTENRKVAFAGSRGRVHPVFGLWALDLADDLEHWLITGSQRKILAFADRHLFVEVPFADANQGKMDPFFNANTPQELAQAETYLKDNA